MNFAKRVFIGSADRENLYATIEYKDGQLSISGPSGQWIMSFRDYDFRGHLALTDVTPAPNWTPDLIKRFLDTWHRWHLNDLQAGTPAQMQYLREHPVNDALDYFKKASEALAAAGLNPDTSYTPPQTGDGPYHLARDTSGGYRYGSAWLREDVPADVLAFLRELPAPTRAPTDDGIYAFVKERGITMTAVQVPENPNMESATPDMRHWHCTLKMGARKLTTYFSQGSAHRKAPTVEQVLDCLACDAAGIENAGSFTDWCAEYGYDEDSRSAKRTHKVCHKQADALSKFLADDYELLLFETPRL